MHQTQISDAGDHDPRGDDVGHRRLNLSNVDGRIALVRDLPITGDARV